MKKFCLILLTVLTVSCSKFKKDYKVVDASSNKRPSWVEKEKYKASAKDEYKYFVSKGENTNQRLCEKTATARATNVVASEIANELVDAYNQSIKNNNSNVSEITSEDLKQTVNMYLAGVENDEKYWEKRKYSTELGAEKDYNQFVCYALIRIKKKTYDNALNASIDRMMDRLKRSEKDADKVNQISNEIKENLLNN